jgi:DNA (cytosine-5)-methyltransferase 1
MTFSSLELCAGGGGQALGLELAGFHHAGLVEYEPQFCTTLRANRPQWNVIQSDIRHINTADFKGVDLLAGGVPCPPFSIAGKQLGSGDDRDMFPGALALAAAIQPRAILLENVPGFASEKFSDYRRNLLQKLSRLGYQPEWKVLQAADFGVPQLRPRFVLVALRPRDAEYFRWPIGCSFRTTVGETLVDLMGANGWRSAGLWANRAATIAPTVVGGSKKHGGPDLGPTRAKKQWRNLNVDGMGIADEAPDYTFPEEHLPRLTVRMVARIQGFPDTWQFMGRKTIAYRQVGNAFPPPVARAVGNSIRAAFTRQFTYADLPDSDVRELRLLEEPEPTKPAPKCRNKKVQKH